MNTIETLKKISRCYDNASDYRIAKLMGVTRSSTSGWRTGRCIMDLNSRKKAAKLLNQDSIIHEIYWNIEVEARAKNTVEKRGWQKALKTITSSAAAVLLTIGLSGNPTPVQAATSNNLTGYILCEVLYLLVLLPIG